MKIYQLYPILLESPVSYIAFKRTYLLFEKWSVNIQLPMKKIEGGCKRGQLKMWTSPTLSVGVVRHLPQCFWNMTMEQQTFVRFFLGETIKPIVGVFQPGETKRLPQSRNLPQNRADNIWNHQRNSAAKLQIDFCGWWLEVACSWPHFFLQLATYQILLHVKIWNNQAEHHLKVNANMLIKNVLRDFGTLVAI